MFSFTARYTDNAANTIKPIMPVEPLAAASSLELLIEIVVITAKVLLRTCPTITDNRLPVR